MILIRTLELDGRKNLLFTVKRIMILLKKIAIVLINVPALNKWVQVFPAVAKTTLGFIHQFLPVGVARSLKKKQADDPDPPELLNMSLDQVFTAPASDDRVVWQKEKGYRQNRALRFIANPLAFVLCILWLCVSRPVLTLHYKTFQQSKTHYREYQKVKRKERAQFLFDLCNQAKSKANEIFDSLESMLNPDSEGHRKHWRLMFAFAGAEWGPAVRLKARNCLLMLMGNVWRRLILAFTFWPWPLTMLVNPDATHGDKLKVCTEFFLLPLCCLDKGVSQKLRGKTRSSIDLMQADLLEFLEEFFSRLAMATQFIECLFAGYLQWLNRSTKPLSIWAVARAHIGRQQMRYHHHCLAEKNYTSMLQRSAKCRPIWAQGKRCRTRTSKRITSFSLFASTKMLELEQHAQREGLNIGSMAFKQNALHEVHKAWKLTPKAQKLKLKQRASRVRLVRIHAPDPLQNYIKELERLHINGVAGLGPLGGDVEFPIAVQEFDEKLLGNGVVDNLSDRFVRLCGYSADETNDFPHSFVDLPPCRERYCKCRDAIGVEKLKAIKAANKLLGLILSTFNKRYSAYSLVRPLLRVKADGIDGYFVQTLSFRLRPLAVELITDWVLGAPFNEDAETFSITTKFPIIPRTENNFWLSVFDAHPSDTQWEFEHLIYEPSPRIDILKITERKDLDMDQLRTELGHAHRQTAALKALKRSLVHWSEVAKTKLGASLRQTVVREVRLCASSFSALHLILNEPLLKSV